MNKNRHIALLYCSEFYLNSQSIELSEKNPLKSSVMLKILIKESYKLSLIPDKGNSLLA
jgi:hypothetical protein